MSENNELGRVRSEPGSRASTEQWVACPNFAGLYEVSNFGRVRSLRKQAIIGLGADKDGYPVARLYSAGLRTTVAVHRLVCRAFHGEPNILHREVAHLDGNRFNPHAENLRWVSRVENHYHKRIHGTHQAKDRAGNRKLNSSQVELIRGSKGCANARQVASQYGVSRHTIYDIWQRRRWS